MAHSALRKNARGHGFPRLAAADTFRHDRGDEIEAAGNGPVRREASMKRIVSAVLASVLAVAAPRTPRRS
jgi:hypothetical protein